MRLLLSKWNRQRYFVKTVLCGVLGLTMLPASASGVDEEMKSDIVQKMKFGLTGVGGVTIPKLTLNERIISGHEKVITGFFEWKLTEKLGLLGGLGYSRVFVVDVANTQHSQQISCLGLKLNRLSIPVVVRFYPGEKRQFCWYIGPRFGAVIGGKQFPLTPTILYDYLDDRGAFKGDLSNLASEVFRAFLNGNHTAEPLSPHARKKYPVVSWDWGFDYETLFGLLVGMEGLGVKLGYNFAPLLESNA